MHDVTAVRYLHLLAMSFFVGGQLMLAAAVVHALRGEVARPQLRAIAGRFGWATLIAIAVLVATGIPMHALEGAIFLGSPGIAWLGVSLAH